MTIYLNTLPNRANLLNHPSRHENRLIRNQPFILLKDNAGPFLWHGFRKRVVNFSEKEGEEEDFFAAFHCQLRPPVRI